MGPTPGNMRCGSHRTCYHGGGNKGKKPKQRHLPPRPYLGSRKGAKKGRISIIGKNYRVLKGKKREQHKGRPTHSEVPSDE